VRLGGQIWLLLALFAPARLLRVARILGDAVGRGRSRRRARFAPRRLRVVVRPRRGRRGRGPRRERRRRRARRERGRGAAGRRRGDGLVDRDDALVDELELSLPVGVGRQVEAEVLVRRSGARVQRDRVHCLRRLDERQLLVVRLRLRHLERLLVALAHLVDPLAAGFGERERARRLADRRVVRGDPRLGLQRQAGDDRHLLLLQHAQLAALPLELLELDHGGLGDGRGRGDRMRLGVAPVGLEVLRHLRHVVEQHQVGQHRWVAAVRIVGAEHLHVAGRDRECGHVECRERAAERRDTHGAGSVRVVLLEVGGGVCGAAVAHVAVEAVEHLEDEA